MMTARGLFVGNQADFLLDDKIILQQQAKRLSKIQIDQF